MRPSRSASHPRTRVPCSSQRWQQTTSRWRLCWGPWLLACQQEIDGTEQSVPPMCRRLVEGLAATGSTRRMVNLLVCDGTCVYSYTERKSSCRSADTSHQVTCRFVRSVCVAACRRSVRNPQSWRHGSPTAHGLAESATRSAAAPKQAISVADTDPKLVCKAKTICSCHCTHKIAVLDWPVNPVGSLVCPCRMLWTVFAPSCSVCKRGASDTACCGVTCLGHSSGRTCMPQRRRRPACQRVPLRR